MAYKALYRQWRPQDFAGLIGQDHVSITLQNALTSGRISHAYLFTGPRGTGKTSTAKVLAKALNCETGPTSTPCNHCSACELITSGSSMDVYEIDAASNRGIDEIRELRENVKFSPAQSRYKIYIIDEVHMLTNEAFNALLKTLEEPPAHVVFVLATTEPHRIPATILSRCQRYDFRRVTVGELTRHLEKIALASEVSVTPDALRLIAVQADGGVRDAVSILDQCILLGSGRVTEEEVRDLLGLVGQEAVYGVFDAIVRRDGAKGLEILEGQLAAGKDARQFLLELAGYSRSLMIVRAAPKMESPVLAMFNRERLAQDSRIFSHEALVRLTEKFFSAANDARWAVDPRITAEMALLTVCENAVSEPIVMSEAVPTPVSKAAATKVSEAKVQPQAIPAKPAQTATPGSNAISSPTDGLQDLGGIWGELRKKVEQAGKRSIKALLEDASLTRLSAGQAVLTFQRESIRERVDKDDIKRWLEELLTQAVGIQVHIQCVAAPPAGSEKKQAETKAGPVAQEYPESVLRLQKLFGGEIIKMDDKGDKA